MKHFYLPIMQSKPNNDISWFIRILKLSSWWSWLLAQHSRLRDDPNCFMFIGFLLVIRGAHMFWFIFIMYFVGWSLGPNRVKIPPNWFFFFDGLSAYLFSESKFCCFYLSCRSNGQNTNRFMRGDKKHLVLLIILLS